LKYELTDQGCGNTTANDDGCGGAIAAAQAYLAEAAKSGDASSIAAAKEKLGATIARGPPPATTGGGGKFEGK
jgi:hypothetical protein